MRTLATALIFLMVSGCSARNFAPVVDIYGQEPRTSKVTAGTHEVRRGETLYSIAWRYGWDYRELARANRIPAPYTIYPGQRISLALKAPASTGSPSSTGNSKPATQVASKPQRQPVSKPEPAKPQTPPASKPSDTASAGSTVGPVSWRWPAGGQVVETFSSANHGRKGIAISGKNNSPVVAAADGRVVYRGSGLTGYGNLLILKHSDRWLSAYAHNDKMLVKEGDAVKAGQQIAAMGATGTFRTQLHFEIRKDGKPVDPLLYLPKK
ncbi:peptidoglycan DD-metalloendopeptidase family protein [uncultured Alcanivorax sp.]|jgi:lipoprotein NlpD|uniref:peptidoglycan DD-metalloendopeptidase family protein n=1 Tax=Alcanivorax sp. TaxID=1872427 RepID=UPI002628D52C|nr:peptidoglycan DD-metalloendopeptidase family protein [uncultured Alcanivorax sp.]